MSVFDQQARLRKLAASYKELLPELDEKAEFYYKNPEYREAWLITQTQYELLSGVIRSLEEILNT
jgi:hypothetical protein